MAEQFVKKSKSREEVVDIFKYVTAKDLKNQEVCKIYENWADEYDKVSNPFRLFFVLFVYCQLATKFISIYWRTFLIRQTKGAVPFL